MFALCATAAIGQTGDIMSVTGRVLVTHAGKEPVDVVRDTRLEKGDVVSTAADGMVQFRAANHAEISLRQNSHLRIDQDSIAGVGDFPQLITRPNDTVQVVIGQAPRIVPNSPGQ